MIELVDFHAGYRDEEKIRIDDLGIEPGRILGLLGRNGSGKSTFLKVLVGIIPYEGHSILDKIETSSMTHRGKARRIAYLPQQLSPVSMSVGTLAAHGRFVRMSFSKVMGEKDRPLGGEVPQCGGALGWREAEGLPGDGLRTGDGVSSSGRAGGVPGHCPSDRDHGTAQTIVFRRQRDCDHFPRPAPERCVL